MGRDGPVVSTGPWTGANSTGATRLSLSRRGVPCSALCSCSSAPCRTTFICVISFFDAHTFACVGRGKTWPDEELGRE